VSEKYNRKMSTKKKIYIKKKKGIDCVTGEIANRFKKKKKKKKKTPVLLVL
jgi:hypothetical protein